MLQKLRTPLLLLLLVTFSTGCSTIKGWFEFDDDEDPYQPAELVDIVESVDVRKLWSTGIGKGQGKGYYRMRPVLANGVIYVSSADGEVQALDADSGKRLWAVELDGGLSGGVGVYEDTVMVGSSDAQVYLLSAADGSERWSTTLHGEVMAPPATDGRIVAVQTYDGKLHGLDYETGDKLWSHDSNMPVLTVRGTSSPIVINNLVLAAFSNGRVIAFDAPSGGVRWEVRVAVPQGRSEIERIVDVDGTLELVGTTLFAVSYQGYLVAVDVATGRKIWQEEASSYVGVSQGFGNVYIAEADGTVSAYLRNGQGLRWQQPALYYRELNRPTPVSSFVAVADYKGVVHFLSQVDGEFVGRVKTDGDGVRADMIADGNRLYVYGNGGKLMAFEVSPRG